VAVAVGLHQQLLQLREVVAEVQELPQEELAGFRLKVTLVAYQGLVFKVVETQEAQTVAVAVAELELLV
jgi:hypothetical protein